MKNEDVSTSKYGFLVVFKDDTVSKKDRHKLIEKVLEDKNVKCVVGKINITFKSQYRVDGGKGKWKRK